jgi:hypothetical protein
MLRQGFPLVVDNVIPRSLVLRTAAELLGQKKIFKSSGQSKHLRTDLILWLNEDTAKEKGLSATSEVISLFKKQITSSISLLSKSGDREASTSVLPKNMIVTLYDGGETFYSAHRDGTYPPTARDLFDCVAQVFSNTWRGGLPAGAHTINFAIDRFRSELNFRNFSAILYLNDIDDNEYSGSESNKEGQTTPISKKECSWNLPTDGGALRCFVGANSGDSIGDTARELIDVAPIGGRVVMFHSRELLHAVQPTQRSRLAMACWVFSDAVLSDSDMSEACVGSGNAR